MKKLLNSIFITILMFVFIPITVFAAGSIKPTTSSLSIKPGGSAKFTIKATNATGKVNISSSNTSVATVSSSTHWMDNDSFTVTVKGKAEGTATITVSLSDAATYDEEELHGSYYIKIKVSAASNSSGSSGGNKPVPEVKNDATLKKLEISGYNIGFDKNKTNYSLEVANDVVELKVNAVPNKSTSKATVSGNTNLRVGENTIKVNVTAADGTKKEYVIKVIRKDEIPETDIDNLSNTLKNTTKDTIALRMSKTTEISADTLKLVKNANKDLIINNYGQDNKLQYSWTILSSSLGENDKYDFGISFISENQDKILKLTNYSEMLNVNFNHSGKLPKGTKIKIYVGDRFADNEKLNLYYYNENEEVMESIEKNLNVENGFISFELNQCSEYILTRAILDDSTATITANNSGINVFLITTIIETIVIIGLIILLVLKRKKIVNKKGGHNKNEK